MIVEGGRCETIFATGSDHIYISGNIADQLENVSWDSIDMQVSLGYNKGVVKRCAILKIKFVEKEYEEKVYVLEEMKDMDALFGFNFFAKHNWQWKGSTLITDEGHIP